MTRDEILAMDGKELTESAHRMGLAPVNTMTVWDESTEAFIGVWHIRNDEPTHEWKPHEDVSQARQAFFDVLPTLGDFDTERNDYRNYAWCDVWVSGDCVASRTWKTQHPNDPILDATEALALLRCSCLALVDAQQRKESTP